MPTTPATMAPPPRPPAPPDPPPRRRLPADPSWQTQKLDSQPQTRPSMSQINPSFNSADPQGDLSALARKLSALEVELKRTVDRTRRRNGSIVFFGIVTVLATAVYVGYAYYRFANEVTPDLVAANVQSQLQD